MATQTGSIDLKAAKAAADIAKDTSQYFWFNSQDSGAGEGAGAHVTEVPSSTFIADPANGGGNALITSSGMAIRDGVTELASFGASGAQIGQNETAHLDIQFDGLSGYGSDGSSYFDFSSSGATITSETIYKLGGTTLDISVAYSEGRKNIIHASKDITDWGETIGDVCTLTQASHQFTSMIDSETGNYFSYRSATPTNCSISHAAMNINIVRNPFSITIGTNSTFSASASVTLKNNNTDYTFLFELYYTYTYSNGMSTITFDLYVTSQTPSCPTLSSNLKSSTGRLSRSYDILAPYMSFGLRPSDETAGGYSATLGHSLYGSSDYQTAVGKYNVQDNADTYAFIVGNGTADNARSNALTVGWNGNVTASGNITDGSGNTLSTIASATNSKLKNITVKGISKSFYIGAGTSTSATTKDISFTSTELEGGSIYNAYVCLGTYQLPYFNVANKLFTWVSSVTSNTITISNSATAWGSSSSPYTAYCVLFLTGTT